MINKILEDGVIDMSWGGCDNGANWFAKSEFIRSMDKNYIEVVRLSVTGTDIGCCRMVWLW